MTLRTITIKIDAGETMCGECEYRRGLTVCELYGAPLRYSEGIEVYRLPECLASEVKEPEHDSH